MADTILLSSYNKAVGVALEEPPEPSPEVQLLSRYTASIDAAVPVVQLLSSYNKVVEVVAAEVVLLDRASMEISATTGVELLARYQTEVAPGPTGVILLDKAEKIVALPGEEPPPDGEDGKVNWWLWGGLAVLAVVIIAAIVRWKA